MAVEASVAALLSRARVELHSCDPYALPRDLAALARARLAKWIAPRSSEAGPYFADARSLVP